MSLVLQNSCGSDSKRKGAGQKIFSFSFYGDTNSDLHNRRAYFKGIRENIDIIKLNFPDWNVRIYHDFSRNDPVYEQLCQIVCQEPILDLCHVHALPFFGNISEIFPMIWRFLPVLDQQGKHNFSVISSTIYTVENNDQSQPHFADLRICNSKILIL